MVIHIYIMFVPKYVLVSNVLHPVARIASLDGNMQETPVV